MILLTSSCKIFSKATWRKLSSSRNVFTTISWTVRWTIFSFSYRAVVLWSALPQLYADFGRRRRRRQQLELQYRQYPMTESTLLAQLRRERLPLSGLPLFSSKAEAAGKNNERNKSNEQKG